MIRMSKLLSTFGIPVVVICVSVYGTFFLNWYEFRFFDQNSLTGKINPYFAMAIVYSIWFLFVALIAVRIIKTNKFRTLLMIGAIIFVVLEFFFGSTWINPSIPVKYQIEAYIVAYLPSFMAVVVFSLVGCFFERRTLNKASKNADGSAAA